MLASNLKKARSAIRRVLDKQKLESIRKHSLTCSLIVDAIYELDSHLPPAELREIEKQRDVLLARDEKLIDGSLGEGGLYDEGLSIGDACNVSKKLKEAELLYLLVRNCGVRNALELGTNVGVSSAYIAAGLKSSKCGERLVTLEASPYRQRIAKHLHAVVHLQNIDYVLGLFLDTLPIVLQKTALIDFAFIDGHHQKKPTLAYFDAIHQYCVPGAIIIFDDIRWSDGMREAWRALQQDRRLSAVIDLNSMGITVVSERDVNNRIVTRPLFSILQQA